MTFPNLFLSKYSFEVEIMLSAKYVYKWRSGGANLFLEWEAEHELIYRFNLFTILLQAQVDMTPPDVSCPRNHTTIVNLNITSVSVYYAEPNVTDTSEEVITTQTHRPGDTFHVGKTVVFYTFQDRSGNVASCNFSVYVVNCKYI